MLNASNSTFVICYFMKDKSRYVYIYVSLHVTHAPQFDIDSRHLTARG